jgi:hypothetical protein
MADDYYQNLEVGGLKSLKDIINLGAYWRDVREEYSGENLIYRGCHYLHNAIDSDDQWEIWKYTYENGIRIREEGPLPGSWQGRGSLEWSSEDEPEEFYSKSNSTESLLGEVLYQLKIINTQLALLTDTEIIDGDV